MGLLALVFGGAILITIVIALTRRENRRARHAHAGDGSCQYSDASWMSGGSDSSSDCGGADSGGCDGGGGDGGGGGD